MAKIIVAIGFTYVSTDSEFTIQISWIVTSSNLYFNMYETMNVATTTSSANKAP